MTPEHKQWTNWILKEVRAVTGTYNDNPSLQRLYHAGFLASYLANILKNDIILRRQFERHIKQLQQRK